MERKTITITKADLDANNVYVGSHNFNELADVNLKITDGLGVVKFLKSIRVYGWIDALAGSGADGSSPWSLMTLTSSITLVGPINCLRTISGPDAGCLSIGQR